MGCSDSKAIDSNDPKPLDSHLTNQLFQTMVLRLGEIRDELKQVPKKIQNEMPSQIEVEKDKYFQQGPRKTKNESKLERSLQILPQISQQITNQSFYISSTQRLSIDLNADKDLISALEKIYKQCKFNNPELEFISKIEEKVSEMYMTLIKKILHQLNHDQISTDQAKTLISEEILILNLNILKVFNKNKQYLYKEETLKALEKFQHNLTKYLKEKYPRGSKLFVPTSLLQKFQDFDRTDELQFDILKNSNTYFGESDDLSITRNIKLFINKIMEECNEWYPIFEKFMKDNVFTVTQSQIQKARTDDIRKEQKRRQSETIASFSQEQNFLLKMAEKQENRIKQNAESYSLFKSQNKKQDSSNKVQQKERQASEPVRELNYKIGRKISENSPTYKKLDTGILQVFSPQILRVLIKWTEGLEETIKKAEGKINESSSFKVFLGTKINEEHSTNQQNSQQYQHQDKFQSLQFDEINKLEGQSLFEEIIKHINQKKYQFAKENKKLIEQLNVFNLNFLKVLNESERNQAYIPIKEAQTIKYSSFNAKFIEYILTQKLVLSIKKLVNVGQQLSLKKKIRLDLVKFKVTDLMRCMVYGNKKEVEFVYERFRLLDEKGLIKILKIKNRLSSSLNDVMIMFLLEQLKAGKKCWIICECQIILTESSGKTDKKNKNVDDLNHYFYELERSPYGILPEIALRLVYKDTKFGYEKKITFKKNKEIDFQKCRKEHRQYFLEQDYQEVPFVCSRCVKFYNKSQNLFRFYQCQKCKTQICVECIIDSNPKYETQFVMKNIEKQLQMKINQYQQKNTSNKTPLGSQVLASRILQLFDAKKIKLTDQNWFKGENKVKGGKLMEKLKLLRNSTVLRQMYDPNQYQRINFIFLVVSFFERSAEFNWYVYDPWSKVIQNTFDEEERYDINSDFLFTNYDMIFTLKHEFYFYSFWQTTKNDEILLGQSSFLENCHVVWLASKEKFQKRIQRVQQNQNGQNKDQYKNYLHPKAIYLNFQMDDKYYLNQDEKKQFNLVLGCASLHNYKLSQKKEFKQNDMSSLMKKYSQTRSSQQRISLINMGIQTFHLIQLFKIEWAYKIKHLNISNNKIDSVEVILQKCLNLQVFNFSLNQVKELKFEHKLSSLKVLEGSNNNIENIEGLECIQNIQKISLPQNQLEDFPYDNSNKFSKLRHLNLSKNKISDLIGIIQYEFSSLLELLLNQQDITQSSQDRNLCRISKVPFEKLQIFQCNKNHHFFTGYVEFESQHLQRLQLSKINCQHFFFRNLTNLKYVNLSGNDIEDVKFLGDDMFSYKGKTYCRNDFIMQLDLSDNRIQSLPLMSFQQLELLNLDKNKLKSIEPLSLPQLQQLKTLNFKDNIFSQIHPLPFNKLKILTIQSLHNDLKNVDVLFNEKSDLESLEQLIISSGIQSRNLNVDFSFNVRAEKSSLKNLKKLSFYYCCFTAKIDQQSCFQIPTLTEWNIIKSQFDETSCSWLPRMILPKLTELDLSVMNLSNLKNLETSQLDSLERLIIKNHLDQNYNKVQFEQNKDINQKPWKISSQPCGLSEIFSCKLNFPQLKYLQITNTNLVSFWGLGQSDFSSLQTLRIRSVDINDKRLLPTSFPQLEWLQFFDFSIQDNLNQFIGFLPSIRVMSINKCGVTNLEDNKLKKLTTLQSLDLEKNKLSHLECSVEFPELNQLHVNNNNLVSLPKIKAPKLTQIKIRNIEIHCKESKIEDISSLSEQCYPSLDEVEFQDLNLNKLKLPALRNQSIKSVTILRCQLSNLTSIDNWVLPNLKHLKFCNNQIEELPPLKFPFIKWLDLSHNRISDISSLFAQKHQNQNVIGTDPQSVQTDKGQFWLSNLKQLNLCHNEIKQICSIDKNNNKVPMFPFKNIESIYLNFNQLEEVDFFSEQSYPNLKYMGLSENRIRKARALPAMPMLKLINLDNNQLELECLSQLMQHPDNLPNLNQLKISYNKLKSLPKQISKLANIQSLGLYKNPIENIDFLEDLNNSSLPSIFMTVFTSQESKQTVQEQINKSRFRKGIKLQIIKTSTTTDLNKAGQSREGQQSINN